MFYDQIMESAAYIRGRIAQEPSIGVVLGSGLGALVDVMEDKEVIPYTEIPHFPQSHVEGHAGNLVLGSIGSRRIIAMQGRFHYYEGFTMKEVTYPLYVMKQLGVQSVIITNACGAINKDFKPGDLMLITDYINFSANNSLIGINDERLGPRFPDMTEAFNKELLAKAEKTAAAHALPRKRAHSSPAMTLTQRRCALQATRFFACISRRKADCSSMLPAYGIRAPHGALYSSFSIFRAFTLSSRVPRET